MKERVFLNLFIRLPLIKKIIKKKFEENLKLFTFSEKRLKTNLVSVTPKNKRK